MQKEVECEHETICPVYLLKVNLSQEAEDKPQHKNSFFVRKALRRTKYKSKQRWHNIKTTTL